MRLPLIAAAFALLAACTNSDDFDETPPDLGNFLLGHNVVVASKAQMGPLSRRATEEEWVNALKPEIERRFRRYDGDHYYHMGVSVEGYIIAAPGIPLVISPKSALILNVTIWDDAQQKKLTPEPEQITVFETFSGDTVIGSGLTKTKEEQMQNLSQNAAKEIEKFLVKNREWFGEAPGPATKPVAPAATAPSGTVTVPPAPASAPAPMPAGAAATSG